MPKFKVPQTVVKLTVTHKTTVNDKILDWLKFGKLGELVYFAKLSSDVV